MLGDLCSRPSVPQEPDVFLTCGLRGRAIEVLNKQPVCVPSNEFRSIPQLHEAIDRRAGHGTGGHIPSDEDAVDIVPVDLS